MHEDQGGSVVGAGRFEHRDVGHPLGAIRPKEARKPDRPTDPRKALASAHRPLRESAARRLAADEEGREFLRQHLKSGDVRVRAASLTALIDSALA